MSLPEDQSVQQLPGPPASRLQELPANSSHVQVTPAPRGDDTAAAVPAPSVHGTGTASDATSYSERPAAADGMMTQLDGPGPLQSKMDADTRIDANAARPTPSSFTRGGAASRLLAPDQQQTYVDPTPATPMASRSPSRDPSVAASGSRSRSSTADADADADDKPYASDDDQEEHEAEPRSEIQSIMEQFSESGGGPDPDEVMSPRLEIASPLLSGPVQHPPRQSSLEPLAPGLAGQLNALHITTTTAAGAAASSSSPSSPPLPLPPPPPPSSSGPSTAPLPRDQPPDDRGPPVPPKDGAQGTPKHSGKRASSIITSPTSPQLSMHRMPPPDPEPEPALPFDFHRFLEQLRNKKADPVARYLKSFLTEFGKRQWMVHEQVKIISDFLAFIANKMMICEVWRDVSDAEFDNAREGMEKLVMNRLYTQTFSPAISPPKPIPGAKPRRKGGDPPMGPGRRGQHQEDVERDDIVTQKINIYGWVKEEHLDIPPLGDSGRRFLKLAQQGLLKHNKADSSADSFMPLLIYVVLQSNPEHLVSNVQYILRFRNQDKLGGEAGYYLSSLMGAVQFIEHLDRTSLTIADDEFERNVEAAVSAIAEKHQAAHPPARSASASASAAASSEKKNSSDSERSRPSLDGAAGPSRPAPAPAPTNDDASASASASSSSPSSSAAAAAAAAPISGLLRTIQNPLSTIGRIFSDESPSTYPSYPPRYRDRDRDRDHPLEDMPLPLPHHHSLSAEDAAARQVHAEVAEAERIQRSEHANVVETLAGMFPDLDKDVISDVVYQKEGRVGLAVDACLALST
ncbi:Vacuolar protein sorting-associated protein 9a [Escovopsis weberi]|uniref:Vacuolar protein sorting-associated protein 9a n=1 Tax=Escovopsis weberi TaxID=150374 RepID=A0A0M8MZC0_ESCWE|nr:Vacuolar protein sorting-associated protein 9a [Escovopsis weberi]